MSTLSADSIAHALFGKTRRRLLALLFGRPDEAFYLRQIARKVDGGVGAVQRELSRLAHAGIINRKPDGSQVYFSANRDSPVFDELRGLMVKTAGIADVIRVALEKVQDRIEIAFLYGSVAEGVQAARSDIDLMIVGEVSLRELLPALGPAQDQLAREITPTIYGPEEWRQKRRSGAHFVNRVLDRTRIFLIGGEDDLGELAGESLAD